MVGGWMQHRALLAEIILCYHTVTLFSPRDTLDGHHSYEADESRLQASYAGLYIQAAFKLGLAEGQWVVVEDSRSRFQVAMRPASATPSFSGRLHCVTNWPA
jgi:hypothetical protein